MTNDEFKEVLDEKLDIYRGILSNNPDLPDIPENEITYDFSCPQFEELKKFYRLEEIAGKGTSFERAVKILRFFAPRLRHDGNFINNIGYNALDLLDYALDNPSHAINCVNKSKILQECCLALGIPARRIWLMPYSPYDTDNHVVTEIYDDGFGKLVMLDMTGNCYFTDKDDTPLSASGLRRNLAENGKCAFKKTVTEYDKAFHDMQTEGLYFTQYYAKNLFYFYVETQNRFGDGGGRLAVFPQNFDLDKREQLNRLYRLGIKQKA